MKISEVFFLSCMFILGTTNLFIPIMGLSEQDMWVGALISFLLGVIYVLFLTSFPQPKNYPPVILIILLLYTLLLASLVTRNITELVILATLPMSPQQVLSSLTVLIASYAALHGMKSISYLAVIAIVPAILSVLALLGLSLPLINFEHLRPVLDHNFGTIFLDALPFISFPFMETIVLLPFLKYMEKPRKGIVWGTVAGGIILVWTVIRNLLVLPPSEIQYYISPTIQLVNSFVLGNFIKAPLIVYWFIIGFIKLAVIILASSKLIDLLFNISYKNKIIPLAIVIINLSLINFDSIIEMFNHGLNIYPLYSIPIQIGVPLFLFLSQLLKKKPGKNVNE